MLINPSSAKEYDKRRSVTINGGAFVPKKKDKSEFSENTTFDESVQVSSNVTQEPFITHDQTSDIHVTRNTSSKRRVFNEELEAYNNTFIDDDEQPLVVVFGTPEQDTSGNNIIGKIIVRKGKIIKYEIDPDALWNEMLRIIHHRIMMSSGSACLLNLRTISKQLTRECNIKSITAVEGEVIRLMSQNFGVKDIDSPKEPRGLKKLRGTVKFWGTVGSRTKHNRKRVARVYAVKEPTAILEYIEGVINVER